METSLFLLEVQILLTCIAKDFVHEISWLHLEINCLIFTFPQAKAACVLIDLCSGVLAPWMAQLIAKVVKLTVCWYYAA